MVADTAIFGPLHVAGYFTHMTVCEGGTMADVRAKLRRDFWPTFSAELAVWPAVQAANFKLVPVQYQLLVVNTFTILGERCGVLECNHEWEWPPIQQAPPSWLQTAAS